MNTTLLQKYLTDAQLAIASAQQAIKTAIQELDGVTSAGTADAITITIAATKVNAFFAPETNASGYPIMELFPASNSPIAKRVQYKSGDRLLAFEDPVRADGGAIYYQIAEPTIRNRAGEKVLYAKLYLRAKDTRL
jgi:hypothetical protein